MPARLSNSTSISANPTRVLLVVHGMNVGGIESYVLNVLRHVDKSRFSIDVCYTGPVAGYLSGEVHTLGSKLISCRYSHTLIPFIWRLCKILRAGRYDTVCDFRSDFAAGSVCAGRLAGVDCRLAFYRNTVVKYEQTLFRRTAARFLRCLVVANSTKVLSNSRAILRAFFRTSREDRARFDVVHNGVDLSIFASPDSQTRVTIRRSMDMPTESIVIGHVGSFNSAKAQHVLLRAFHHVVKVHREARLVFVGEGPRKDGVRQLAVDLGVEERVIFAGLRSDVPQVLAAMDLFVFPSFFEGFPNALLEAQAVGLPVITSNRPEIMEALPPENHDCVTPVGDDNALAEKILALLADPRLARRKGAIGSDFVRKKLSIGRSVEGLSSHLAGA